MRVSSTHSGSDAVLQFHSPTSLQWQKLPSVISPPSSRRYCCTREEEPETVTARNTRDGARSSLTTITHMWGKCASCDRNFPIMWACHGTHSNCGGCVRVCVCEGWGRWQSTQTIFNIYFLFALSITIFPPHHSHHMAVPIQPGNYNCARTPPSLIINSNVYTLMLHFKQFPSIRHLSSPASPK